MKPFVLSCTLTLMLLCNACQRDAANSPKGIGTLTPWEDGRAPMPAPDALAVPVEFQGNWAESAGACGKRQQAQLQIGRDRVRLGGREGLIVASTQDERTLDLQIQREDKGQTWQAHHRFALAEGGNTLTDVAAKGEGRAWVRCPP